VMPAVGLDTLTIFAAAAVTTERIRLGTAIVPAFTRHPIAMADQVMALESFAPGRLRLGIGTAHARTMEAVFHFDFSRPLSWLREYTEVLLPLLHEGEVHFAGDFYQVDASIPAPTHTPIYHSALRSPAFELAGEMTAGGLAWLCPPEYLRRIALPALQAGADKAGRPRPPLIAHMPVVVTPDRDRAYAVARQQIGYYAAAPFYARMFADAGHPLDAEGRITDGLLDILLVYGTPDEIARKLQERLDGGMDEIYPSMFPLDDQVREEDILLGILGELARG
jgi:alkanesulfonate monooxygenase SsuD/methylene tetrahydromethanopterin reductase-like flavin-dependent oxidoreductase (luciferase family)